MAAVASRVGLALGGECSANETEPLFEGLVVINITLDAVAEALASEFFENGVEIFGALVEIRIFGIAESQHGEAGVFKAGSRIGMKEFVKFLGVVGWFAIAVGGGDDEEVFDFGDGFGVRFGHVGDGDLVTFGGEGFGGLFGESF